MDKLGHYILASVFVGAAAYGWQAGIPGWDYWLLGILMVIT